MVTKRQQGWYLYQVKIEFESQTVTRDKEGHNDKRTNSSGRYDSYKYKYTTLMYSFSNFEPVSFSMSNFCFLICIQVSQETGKVVWYSRLFKFPQFIVIHTVEGFWVSVKQKEMFFRNSLAFSMIQWMLAIWSLVLLPFLNLACTSGGSWSTYCWSQLECKMLGWVNQRLESRLPGEISTASDM